MKWLANILLIYFCALVFQPGVDQLYTILQPNSSETSSCCSGKCCKPIAETPGKKQEERKPYNCCPKGDCNPLVQCSRCVGFLFIPMESIKSINSYLPWNFTFSEKENLESGFLTELFHPPNLV